MGTGFLHVTIPLFVLLLCFQIGSAGWGDWSPWASCSATCGNGVQTRIRHCTVDPSEALQCVYANQTEEYQCYAGVTCPPIDGAWSAYRPWSHCTRKCGTGTRKRWRTCENPKPQYGGKVCEGSRLETASCINPACAPLYLGENLTKCPEGHVHCASGSQCIPEYRRCDYLYDCVDGSDESACQEGEPVEIYFKSGVSPIVSSLTVTMILSAFTMLVSSYGR